VSTLFELSGVVFRYPETPALDGVDLQVTAGERVAVLGANGSGKSTLLQILDGLLFPQSGSVAFDGRVLGEEPLADPDFRREFRRRVAFVFQDPDVQLFNPTVFDELAFGPLQLALTASEVRERVEATIASLGIQSLRERSPHRLSLGEKKRVALASALVMEPEVLLLDEPTASLDPRSQSGMIDFLASSGGRLTVVAAIHDLGILEDIADRCVVLGRGCVAAQGPPGAILGDEALLLQTGLQHSHRHRHASGLVHSHPHRHRSHGHSHDEE
jgi:cobalt/nickel transport system ATP-binding protein